MTLEQYKAELNKALEEAGPLHRKAKDGPAYRVIVTASKDRNLKLHEWQELEDRYYSSGD